MYKEGIFLAALLCGGVFAQFKRIHGINEFFCQLLLWNEQFVKKKKICFSSLSANSLFMGRNSVKLS